ncbi:AfsR/SARP family transcriptional regulator [Nocardia brasiliensis]|uniref:AfsR/SARP family transcriptional regulator n=1 Tax=Nocardia brasiliensis TaxID=37326 RepID=UPI003D8A050B
MEVSETRPRNELRFTVLGPLQVGTADRAYAVQGAKVKTILAALLARADRPVSVAALSTELWGGRPPGHPETTVRVHIYHLRRALGRYLSVPGEQIVRTEPTGYRLVAGTAQIDAGQFDTWGERSVTLLRRGLPEAAAVLAQDALRLWQGSSALPHVTPGPIVSSYVNYLDERRLRVLGCHADALMALGQFADLVAALRELVADHPLDESFHLRLIEALHRSGRRADALRACQELRRVLDRELGLGPSAQMLELEQEILRAPEPASV